MWAKPCEIEVLAANSLKAERPHRFDVADRAVGRVADATERLQDAGVNRADKRAKARPRVDVLDHHDARRRDADDVVPPVGAVVIAMTDRRRSEHRILAVTA